MNLPSWIPDRAALRRVVDDAVAKARGATPKGKDAKKKWLRVLGYAGFFVAAFLFFCYLVFPYDRLRLALTSAVEGGEAGVESPWELEIIDLSPSFFTGVSLEGVRLAKRSESPDDPKAEVLIEELDLRVSVLSLLVGTLSIDVDAELADGEIEATLALPLGEVLDGESPTEWELELDVDQIDLRRVGITRAYFSLPLTGRLSGEADVTFGPDDEHTTGMVRLAATNVEIGDGQARLKVERLGEGLMIEKIAAGNLTIEIDVENGVASVKKLEARGQDIQLDGAGAIHLARPVGNSRIDLMIRAVFDDGYRNRSDRTRAIFSLFDFNPVLRAAKTSDGAIQYRINGTFRTPLRASPAGRAEMPTAP